jgi:hypothetical protein
MFVVKDNEILFPGGALRSAPMPGSSNASQVADLTTSPGSLSSLKAGARVLERPSRNEPVRGWILPFLVAQRNSRTVAIGRDVLE